MNLWYSGYYGKITNLEALYTLIHVGMDVDGFGGDFVFRLFFSFISIQALDNILHLHCCWHKSKHTSRVKSL